MVQPFRVLLFPVPSLSSPSSPAAMISAFFSLRASRTVKGASLGRLGPRRGRPHSRLEDVHPRGPARTSTSRSRRGRPPRPASPPSAACRWRAGLGAPSSVLWVSGQAEQQAATAAARTTSHRKSGRGWEDVAPSPERMPEGPKHREEMRPKPAALAPANGFVLGTSSSSSPMAPEPMGPPPMVIALKLARRRGRS